MNQSAPVVLAITGASGAVYAAGLLSELLRSGQTVHLTVSQSGAEVIRQELKIDFRPDNPDCAELLRASERLLELKTSTADQAEEALASQQLMCHDHKDYFTPIASGSYLTSAMVICPCSGSTLSGIAHSASQNLIQRAAEVHLKERRKLVLVPRETPLSTFQIENMHRLSQAGAVILPAAPGWYQDPTSLADLVKFVVSRILDQLGVRHSTKRWADGS